MAEVALGRGAVETTEGKRYCAPCAGKLQKELTPEADRVRKVTPGSSVAMPVIIPAKKTPEKVSTAAGPARRTARGGSGRKKPRGRKTSDRTKRKARRPSSERPVAARRQSSNRVTPGKRRSGGGPLPDDAGTSQRASRRSATYDLPWYFKLNRSQWIGIAAGSGAFLLFVIIFVAWASSGPPPKRTRNRPPLSIAGNPTGMMAEAQRLFQSGKRREALRMLERARDLADKQGRERLVVQINQKIHGIRFKTVP